MLKRKQQLQWFQQLGGALFLLGLVLGGAVGSLWSRFGKGGSQVMPQVTLGQTNAQEALITHSVNQVETVDLAPYRERLRRLAHPTFSLAEEEKWLQELSEFDLGRFLLKNRGLNGYWTSYLILYAPHRKNLSPLEHWFVHAAPTVRATRERFGIFQRLLQRSLRSGIRIASIPGGVLDDLLSLDLTGFENVQLVGIDFDEESLRFAQRRALAMYREVPQLFKKDAWNLEEVASQYDVIVSNGLNIYESSVDRVVALYREFARALKPGGILITSFLTPPPMLSPASPWKNYSQEDAKKQKAIFGDILEAKWQVFYTEEEIRRQFEQAGLRVLEVIEDSQGIFPTVLVEKPKA